MGYLAKTIKSMVVVAMSAATFVSVSVVADARGRNAKHAQALNPLVADFSVRQSDLHEDEPSHKKKFRVLRRVAASMAMIIGEAADTDGVKERLIRPGNPTQRH